MEKLFEEIYKLKETAPTKLEVDEALSKCETALKSIFETLPVDIDNLMEVIFIEIMDNLSSDDVDWM